MGGAAGGAGSRPPALPRPGRRGRSVGTARRAHLAGSHPSARRGARWERGPGRRGLSALTGRAAEAPARRRSASRPSRASRASYSGDEEPSRHPAQIAAAAGRLHCLTITRAGFSPRIPRLLLPFSHCGPCLCLFFWNVLGVLTSVTVDLPECSPLPDRCWVLNVCGTYACMHACADPASEFNFQGCCINDDFLLDLLLECNSEQHTEFFPPGIYNLVRDTEQKARNNKVIMSSLRFEGIK
ncbi:zinc finger protein 664 isoform X3 [Balaenoptera acutorostrata]|uniref:Zinc finger protein 664 isoform X3 n=1 Tax=Balaenoptera acutorostrata TaxID=9767 RepID=A0ABM3S0H0_BALAC|nr:zinc finger protein 664 isoform X3 [Balaenoptera acutorostrata]